jgi:hypothetical protein
MTGPNRRAHPDFDPDLDRRVRQDSFEEDEVEFCDGCNLPGDACCCPDDDAEFTDEDL